MNTNTGTITVIIILGVSIFFLVYFSSRKQSFEKFSIYDSPTVFKPALKRSDIACNLPQPSKRYMYQPVPPARNSSYDVRNPPSFTPPADRSKIGIFKHTDIFGNYTNERICPNYQQMENAINNRN